MLYTRTHPAEQSDRIRLFSSFAAACAGSGDGPVSGLAVGVDSRARCLVPLLVDPEDFDPCWTTPIQFHGDGSITARGRIPEALFVDLSMSDALHAEARRCGPSTIRTSFDTPTPIPRSTLARRWASAAYASGGDPQR